MLQKQKLAIGLAVIAVLAIAGVISFFGLTGKINIGATGETPVFAPTQLNLTVGQIYPIKVSGGTLPYGGYISTNPDYAAVESWYSYSVASGTTDPALSLVVKGINPGTTTIKIWDQSGTVSELPVAVKDAPTSANSKVKFSETSLKMDLGKQCETVIISSEGASNFWAHSIVSDPQVAVPTRFGGKNVGGTVQQAFRVYGAKVGKSSVLLENADGDIAKFDIEVVQNGGTCEDATKDIGNPQIGDDTTFSPVTSPQLLVGQMLAVEATATGKIGGFMVDKPDVLSVDSWNAVGTDEKINYLVLRGVSAGTANLYLWDQNGNVSQYTVTVAASNQVNTKAAFSPTSATIKVGEESDLVVELNDQKSQWVSVIAGDSRVALPARFGAVEQGSQVKPAIRIKGIKAGSTSYTLIHKDGNVAKVDVLVK